jgi:hypothetical protein
MSARRLDELFGISGQLQNGVAISDRINAHFDSAIATNATIRLQKWRAKRFQWRSRGS